MSSKLQPSRSLYPNCRKPRLGKSECFKSRGKATLQQMQSGSSAKLLATTPWQHSTLAVFSQCEVFIIMYSPSELLAISNSSMHSSHCSSFPQRQRCMVIKNQFMSSKTESSVSYYWEFSFSFIRSDCEIGT